MPLYIPGSPVETFLPLGPIVELNNIFKELPGHSSCFIFSVKYGEYIVSPIKLELPRPINVLLLDKTTVEVLPYLSDNTTPT